MKCAECGNAGWCPARRNEPSLAGCASGDPLLPCPFCGSSALSVSHRWAGGKFIATVSCHGCGACMDSKEPEDDEEEAVYAAACLWNTRKSRPAV